MKRYALILTMVAVFAISASIAVATTLYSPWMIDNPSSSWGTQVVVFNTDDVQRTQNYTLRKVGQPTTSTTQSITVAGKTSELITWVTGWPDNRSGFITTDSPGLPAGGKFATFEMDNTNAYFIGFTFRFMLDFNVIYSEPLFSWPIYAATGDANITYSDL